MHNEFDLIIYIIVLVLLLFVSAFFSSAETAMMALNRYKLRHEVREGRRSAIRVNRLLKRTDRLLGLILTGNTFANILASAMATLIATTYLDSWGALLASVLLTVIVLIFAEMAPKTLATHHALRWAKISSLPIEWLLAVLYPVVISLNFVANGFLRLFGAQFRAHKMVDALSHEELRTVVHEAQPQLSKKYLNMLVGILDLRQLTVNDIMIPRGEIFGIDLNSPWQDVLARIQKSQYARLPVYEDSLDNVLGVLRVRDVSNFLMSGDLNKETMRAMLLKPFFIPEATALYSQLINFQKEKRRSALVVDEYGAVIGLATLEDILEEIVGEFTTDITAAAKLADKQVDGSYLIRGNVNIRDLNKVMNWQLPIEGAKTISGLIIDAMQAIPEAPLCLRMKGYQLDVLQIKNNKIKLIRLRMV